ncbi:MAG: hypothetical protein KAI18_04245 [Candidatus Aenigmarchaeota archaeon]|nr:hypothetical protein [Candidatus Aenigmarchaeota archaeon]
MPSDTSSKEDHNDQFIDHMMIDLNAKIDAINTKLDNENYKKRGFWAQYDHHNSDLLIYEGKTIKEKIPYETLKNILDKETEYSGEYCNTIKEWYNILSFFVYQHKGDRLQNQKTIAENKNDSEQISRLDSEFEKLINEFEENYTDLKKKELAFYYKEEGQRLERLYEILYIEQENTIIKMGDMKIKAFEVENITELEEGAYEESKGFFEDMNSAIQLIAKAEGVIRKTSENESYNNEHIKASGKKIIEINDRSIELEAKIVKNGSRDELYWNIFAKPIELSLKEFLEKTWNRIPDYDNSLDELRMIDFTSEDEAKNFKLVYRPDVMGNKILFKGPPCILKETIPEILSLIL